MSRDRNRRMSRPAGEAGYALVDAIVALAILAVMLGLFFEVVETTLAARRHAGESRRAVLVAQSQLAVAEAQRDLAASGQDGALAWRTVVEPYPGQPNGRGLEQVSVLVTDRETGQRLTTLPTLRLSH